MLVKSNNLIWLNSIPLGSNAGVNFTNILRAAFAPIFLRQKSTNLKCKNKQDGLDQFHDSSKVNALC
jgi:hypothetical protein